MNVISYYSSEIFLEVSPSYRSYFFSTGSLTEALGQLFSAGCSSCLTRLGPNQLAPINPGNLHNRHIRPTQSPITHLPTHVHGNAIHRVQLLDPREQPPCTSRLHRFGNISFRRGLLTGRGTSAIYIHSRSVPAIRPIIWNGARHGNDVVL